METIILTVVLAASLTCVISFIRQSLKEGQMCKCKAYPSGCPHGKHIKSGKCEKEG